MSRDHSLPPAPGRATLARGGSGARRPSGHASALPEGVIRAQTEGPGGAAVRRRMVEGREGPFHVIEQGEGPAVLFCHGFPDTADTWFSQMEAVAAAGYRAVALDMRGYGYSYSPEDPDLYSAPYIIGDLVWVLDALFIDRAVVVGHQWGAYMAQVASLMRPDRFRALVSIGVPFFWPHAWVDPLRALLDYGLKSGVSLARIAGPDTEELLRNPDAAIRSMLYWMSASPSPASRWDPIEPRLHMLRPSPVEVPAWANQRYVRHTIEAFRHSGFQGALNYFRAYEKSNAMLAAYKGAVIRQPSLHLWGADDALSRVLNEEAPALPVVGSGPPERAGQIRLENVGYWAHHEAADRVNAALRGFLARL